MAQKPKGSRLAPRLCPFLLVGSLAVWVLISTSAVRSGVRQQVLLKVTGAPGSSGGV